MKQATYENEVWNVLSAGSVNDHGLVYVHLAHKTEGKQQQNGFYPRQVCTWIEPTSITAA